MSQLPKRAARRWLVLGLVAPVLAITLSGCTSYQATPSRAPQSSDSSPKQTSSQAPSPPATNSPSDSALPSPPVEEPGVGTVVITGILANDLDPAFTLVEARAALVTMTVAGPPGQPYSRDAFGSGWASNARTHGWDSQSGCNTRQAALMRDGQDVAVTANCKPETGTWLDPYSGVTLTNPSSLDIDHVVPLAEAWRTGAWQWDKDRRVALANDPLEVIAVDGSQNKSKSDKGPEAWRPQNSAWCGYSLRWVAVKDKYALGLSSEAERSALEEMLDTCLVSSAQVDETMPTEAPSSPTATNSPVPPTPTGPPVVHPGALCSPEGAVGVTSKGTAMQCITTTQDPKARWRAQ